MRFLRTRHRVAIVGEWDGSAVDCMVALHARRSAASIEAFAAQCPGKPLVVVLTGTDLYRDIHVDPSAQRSLDLATHLVVLNELGMETLPRHVRSKARVILQSAPALSRAKKSSRHFLVAVVGHLRAEKNPELVWKVLDKIDPQLPLRIVHAGASLEDALRAKALNIGRSDARYEWLDDQPRPFVRQLMRKAHLLLHPSVMEGGAHVVIEAVTAHTAVIASRVDGNVGLLGREYNGFFAVDDVQAAAHLIERAAREARFLQSLERACDRRAGRFAPAQESAAVNRLIDNAVRQSGWNTR